MSSNIKIGIAVDIDETLSATVNCYVEHMFALFGNPEHLSVKEFIEKYRYSYNAPFFQTPEAKAWSHQARKDGQLQLKVQPIPGAVEGLNAVHKIIPVTLYLTNRPESIHDSTKLWLQKHGFPDAPIMLKPEELPLDRANHWKAEKLTELYPNIVGLIDDNPKIVSLISSNYKGKVFFYDSESTDREDIEIYPCKDWHAVIQAVKKQFGQENE